MALCLAHAFAAAVAFAIVVPLGWDTLAGGVGASTARMLTMAVILVALGTLGVGFGGVLSISGPLEWFVPAQEPDRPQRRAAMRLPVRQSMILAATWAMSGIVFILSNLEGGIAIAVSTVLGVITGGSVAGWAALLLTQRTIRPIMVAAARDSDDEGGLAVPGVQSRLITFWLLFSAVPSGTIAALVIIQSNGWVIAQTASVEIPILVVSLAAVFVGLPAMIVTSRSISDPISEVVDAMAKVERGQAYPYLGVYERSEIGRLQAGFNRMLAGLAERDRVRDLFGRHVGIDVARRAIEDGSPQSGDVQEVAILFIDLVGSTPLAVSRPPRQVAEVLNDFFRIVVRVIDEHDGVINKFQGDAALAVFGAPLRTDNAASQALASARSLQSELRRLPEVDFGIGVSAGPVFAGNIGAADRYEYTVIGDAVNEAARLADAAKAHRERILSSSAAVDRADTTERPRWDSRGSTLLRGRRDATLICTPASGP